MLISTGGYGMVVMGTEPSDGLDERNSHSNRMPLIFERSSADSGRFCSLENLVTKASL
jgi:hypothetical protein